MISTWFSALRYQCRPSSFHGMVPNQNMYFLPCVCSLDRYGQFFLCVFFHTGMVPFICLWSLTHMYGPFCVYAVFHADVVCFMFVLSLTLVWSVSRLCGPLHPCGLFVRSLTPMWSVCAVSHTHVVCLCGLSHPCGLFVRSLTPM